MWEERLPITEESFNIKRLVELFVMEATGSDEVWRKVTSRDGVGV